VIHLKTDLDFTEIVVKENSQRRGLREPLIGTHRIEIELVDRLHFLASHGRFSFAIDEPAERGGTETGLPPLAFFLAGAASCLMTQYMKLAEEKQIQFDTMRTVVRGHFDRQIGGAFTDIQYDIELQSSSNPDAIRTIALEAEGMCYAHNTLKKTVKMKTTLTLNGKRLE
jgi:uncharacterized OsmC-like protein